MLTTIIIIIFIIFDSYDRGNYSQRLVEKKYQIEFFDHKNFEEIQKAFEKQFKNPKYNFPGAEVCYVKIYKNHFLISRLNSKKINHIEKLQLINFFNDPENFDWSETTWELNEAEYIIRFYNNKDLEIGKVWLCLRECGMTFSKPFSPNMKFGGISESGKLKICNILKISN